MHLYINIHKYGLPCGSVVKKNLPANERTPGEGNGNPLQYSCLRNTMDRGAWQAVQSMGSQKNWTQLSN